MGGIIISDDVDMMCGLEIHVQLETESKLFCDCPTNLILQMRKLWKMH